MKKKVMGFLVLLFICLPFQSTVFAQFTIEMGPYLNLLSAPGGQWLYEDENGNEAWVEVLAPGPFNGIPDAGQIQMVSIDAEGVEQTVIEYYQMFGDGWYEIGTEEYQGGGTDPYLSILFDADYKKIISLPQMDADADPLESAGQGSVYYNGILLGKADYSSSVDVEGIEILVMPYGVFEVLRLTSTQSYTHYIIGTIESTFTVYIEPSLGVLALDDENGRMSLTGIYNISVPGDTDDDGDVDGLDLADAVVDTDMEALARYFGAAVPIIVN